MSIIEIIRNRTSVRSYSDIKLTNEVKRKAVEIITKKRTGPFGNSFQFSLINTEDKNLEELGKLTSYGLIKGATLFFGGYSAPEDRAVFDYGYCFQEALLELTSLNLGTCWLGGTFGRSFIAKALKLPDGKVIPAISPIGISLKKRSFADKAARFIAKSDNRKPEDKLFFSDSAEGVVPLKMSEIKEEQRDILEAVRLAPSASNKQPWRIIIQDEKLHLYWDYDDKYNKPIKSFNIQALDMGIALYHIRIAAEELHLDTSFIFTEPEIDTPSWRYIASWEAKL